MKLLSRIFSMLLLASAFSVLFCAPTFAEESLSITVDGVAETELDPNTFGTSSVDVYVTSTARDGYKLSISDSDNENALVSGQGNAINALSGSVTAENFTTNAWGVKVGDNFLPVPKLSDNVLDLATTSAPATNEKHTVTFGMKVDGTATSGAYSSEVVFTAVANPLSVRRATLQTGPNVNAAWKTLANDTATLYTTNDNKITSVQKFTGEFTDALRAAAQDIAISESDWPVYTWFDNGTIYYYTEADEVFFNADSNSMFYAMKKLVSVDFNFGLATDVDPDGDGFIDSAPDPVYITSEVTNIYRMFHGDSALTTLDVSKWDTSNITNMSTVFRGASSLTSLDVSHWDTSKVTKMNNMFHDATALATLDVSDWDTSNVDDISYMFDGTHLSSIAVDDWDTSKITKTSFAFAHTSYLTNLNVSDWDMSKVTNASGMFEGASSLATLDVSDWNVDSLVFASWMFNGASSLNGLDVSGWHTGNVTEMQYMFAATASLTSLDVSHWDTSKVTTMGYMFNGASALDGLDVSSWNTGNVTNMISTFNGASSLTSLDVSHWNTSKVVNMSSMFRQASGLTTIDVSSWVTNNVTSMSNMFRDATGFTTLDVSGWNTGKVTDMSNMFDGASSIDGLDVSDWDVSIVRNMSYMFTNASSLSSLDVSDWITSSVTTMEGMFSGVTLASLDVSHWNTSNVTRMDNMFRNTPALTGLNFSDWDTSKVTRMGEMFYNAAAITTLDLSSWDTSKVTAMDRMFNNATALTTIYASDQFVVGSSMTSVNMFTDSTNLVGGNGTTYDANHITKEYAHIDVAGNPGYFSEKIAVRKATLKTGKQVSVIWKSLAKGNVTYYDNADQVITSIQKFTGDFTDSIQSSAMDIAIEDSDCPVYTWFDNGTIYYYTEADEVFFNADSSYMFYDMQELASVDFNFGVETDVDPDGDGFIASVKDPVYITSNIADMSYMFYYAPSLTSLDVSNWDTSSVTNMSYIFYNTLSLTPLDVSNWDTSKVTRMEYMFFKASSLTSLDVSNWDTSKVINMSQMFYNASSLTSLDVSNWDTSSATNMKGMFAYVSSLTSLNVSNWNTGKVTDMSDMFSKASSLTSLDVSNWDTSSVTNMSTMFYYASSLTSLDVSNWDTSSVTNMNAMFTSASSLTSLDVSNWDTSKVISMNGMFYNASALTTIYASDKFNTGAVTGSVSMFTGASRLVGGNGTVYDTSHVDKEYARIDAPGTPGYFTLKTYTVRTSTLKTGPQVNVAWKTLAGDASAIHYSDNSDITSIQPFTGNFTSTIQASAVNIATDDSDYPVWSWFDNGTIYYYTESDEVFLNADCNNMFGSFGALTSIDFNFGLATDVDSDGDGIITSRKAPVYITSRVTNMESMFYRNNLAVIDLTGMDTSSVTSMNYMFSKLGSLTTIYASNLFTTNSVAGNNDIFYGTDSLVGGNGTTWDWGRTGKEYARIDTPTTPGYFTLKSN